MEISWTDHVRNEETLLRVKEQRNILHEISKRKANWISHILCLVTWCTHHVTRHYTSIHNLLSTAPQLNISQKALGTLPEDGSVVPKHVGATIHN
jgi:hypothetical protein